MPRLGISTILAASFVLVGLSGCMTSGSGVFQLLLSDDANAIGDFEHLNVTISQVRLHAANANNDSGWQEFAPRESRIDLTNLVGSNETTLVKESIAEGKYTRIELVVTDAVGTLKESHEQVAVKVPSGRLFLERPFEVENGKQVQFVFDVEVVKTGALPTSREYQLQPNAGTSGPR